MNKLIIILPCYNESEIFARTLTTLLELMARYKSQKLIDQTSALCFVDDGSRDDTWAQIERACELHTGDVLGIKLSRNFGHQAALLSAMESLYGSADLYVTIDADLQDDPQVIGNMIEKANEGANVVYGVRASRKSDSWFKRSSALAYYRLMRFMGVDMVYNHADFRLFDNRVLGQVLQFRESNLFLRGLFPLVGFRGDTVYYDRLERMAGQSKYPLFKMLAFAWEGATSFSVRPIRFVLHIGIVATLLALAILIWTFVVWVSGDVVAGWSSLIGVVAFFGGIQMISIGIIGEYVGKTYKETKSRPRYIIEKTIGEKV